MTREYPPTLFHTFVKLATSPLSSSWNVIECSEDTLTYGELLGIVRGIARELSGTFGSIPPTVAIISENHPYIFAVILATWLLGGVVAPLDYHAPEALMRGMLEIVEPTCIVLPASDKTNLDLSRGMGIPIYSFGPVDSGISQLIRRFPLNQSLDPEAPWLTNLTPCEADALYIFTSSASSTSTLKCVPLTHQSIYSNCRAQIDWLRSAFPSTSFKRLRVLGWGGWTHIMGISHDIGTHCFLTGGCYIFGLVPSTYMVSTTSRERSDADLGHMLLDTAVRSGTTAFSGVPWIVRKFMEIENDLKLNPESEESKLITQALRNFKIMISGGATTDLEITQWAETTSVNLVIGIGMTEFGGPVFHTRAISSAKPGWPLSQPLVPDVIIDLIDDSGYKSQEGELVVKSKFISQGYHRYDTNTFSKDSSGVVTFRTGDIYRLDEDHIIWQGRREDYIQLLSGEILDPRIPEKTLDSNALISRSCLVGDKWLTGASKSVCALIEPEPSEGRFVPDELITALAAVNRGLTPPLRIALSRVLVLESGEKIPMTRKGIISRKALEVYFGERLKALLADPKLSQINKTALPRWSPPEVESSVTDIVAKVLGLSRILMEQHAQSTFAELGMDSQMAIGIVNALNRKFGLRLPLNACHDFVDLSQLSRAIFYKLGLLGALPVYVPAPFILPAERDEVVIIGQALRLPGGINTVDAFWGALTNRSEALLGPIPADRWNHASFFDPTGTQGPGSINFDRAGFIDVASFDNAFFGISSAEAYFVSPAARLALETAVEALENANIPLSSIKGSNMGVFVAAPDDGYAQLMLADRGYGAYTRYYGSGIATSTVCGRISYFLDIHGPSVSLDTACSAGMVALDSAVQYIKQGDGEAAIVCSSNTHLWPGIFSFLSANQMASPRGRCASFSADADGYVPSEGVVSFILKRKSAALRDRNNILGIIKSTTVQHNGRSQGLIAPNAQSQANLQRTLLSKANLGPKDIDFLETHGTGTILGDLLEVQAINEVFSGSHSEDRPLVLGASKTVIGHTESSAGLVGVMSSLVSLRTGIVPGLNHLNDKNFNPHIDTTQCPLAIPHFNWSLSHRERVTNQPPLRSLNLAYGFAGTISGVVLEEHVDESNLSINSTETRPENSTAHKSLLFVLSAKTAKALTEYIKLYIDFCRHSRDEDLANICYTSCVGREHYRYRFACVVKTMPELIVRLQTTLSNSDGRIFNPINTRPCLIFGFPGQGSQYQGMARDLCLHNTGFDSLLRKHAKEATNLLGIDIMSFLLEQSLPDAASQDNIDQTHIAQVCIYTFQCAVVQWLQSIGVNPQGVLPHSLGEIAAAVTAGVMSFRTGLEFTVMRSMAMRPVPGQPGAMAVVHAAYMFIADSIQTLNLQDSVCIAGFNSTSLHVVSGEKHAVEKLLSILSPKVRFKVLAVNQAFHSHCIDHALIPIRQWLDDQASAFQSPTIPFYSSAQGDRVGISESMGPEYWVKQARNPILFANAAANAARDSTTMVLDIGPQPVLASLLVDIPGFSSISVASLVSKRGKDTENAFMVAMATLFVHGVTPEFFTFFAGQHGPMKNIPLPTYVWQKQRHFPTIVPSKHHSAGQGAPLPALWNIDDDLIRLLRDHSLDMNPVVPTAAMAILASQSIRSNGGHDFPQINMHILKPLVLDSIPGHQLIMEQASSGSTYTLAHRRTSSPPDIVCTVQIYHDHPNHRLHFDTPADSSPGSVMMKSDVYARLEGGPVNFGPKFQNLLEIRIWPHRADGTVSIELSGNPRCDLIRQLDPCLHMFGAITPRNLPEHEGPGSFLPAALTGFRLFVQSLPCIFICRYKLPMKVERNFKKMTTSFDVVSQSGDLLASCEEYSVAWIPADISLAPIVDCVLAQNEPSLLRTVWKHVPRPDALPQLADPNLPSPCRLVYVGSNPKLQASLQNKALNHGYSFVGSDQLPGPEGCPDIIIYDALLPDDEIGMNKVIAYSNAALQFMKAVSSELRTRNFASVIFLTRNAFIILPDDTDGALALTTPNCSGMELAGSLVQGMLRVLRNECSAQNVHGLDVPSISFDGIADLVMNEITSSSSNIYSPLAYRHNSEGELIRITSFLRKESTPRNLESLSAATGSVLIVGLGHIGRALAGKFARAGYTGIIFIGRRPEHDPEILLILQDLRTIYAKTRFVYYSADVTSLSSLRDALVVAATEEAFERIETVVHTAGIIKDSLIGNTTSDVFQAVIGPKVFGSWNLHLACSELKLDVRRFILLSSISVPLGNIGQIAYVAANSFLDTLAQYRTFISPTLRSISLQLGAWESRLIEGMKFDDEPMEPISHTEGLPLLLKMIEGTRPVQILAKLLPDRMQKVGMYTKDPYFSEFLDTTPSSYSGPMEGTKRQEVEDVLKTVLKELLEMIPDEELDLDTSLASLGLDSIAFTQLRGALIRKFGVDIPLNLLDDQWVAMDIVDHIMT